MTFMTLFTIAVTALGIGLIVGSLIVEGRPRRPPGPILLSGFYIACLGSLAAVLNVIVNS